MLYQIKSKKKLISSLFNEEKLSLLIFHQVKLKKELILHRYFAGKLKICFIKPCRKQNYFLTYRDSWIFVVRWGKKMSAKVQIRENPGQRGKVKAGALEAYENWV